MIFLEVEYGLVELTGANLYVFALACRIEDTPSHELRVDKGADESVWRAFAGTEAECLSVLSRIASLIDTAHHRGRVIRRASYQPEATP